MDKSSYKIFSISADVSKKKRLPRSKLASNVSVSVPTLYPKNLSSTLSFFSCDEFSCFEPKSHSSYRTVLKYCNNLFPFLILMPWPFPGLTRPPTDSIFFECLIYVYFFFNRTSPSLCRSISLKNGKGDTNNAFAFDNPIYMQRYIE